MRRNGSVLLQGSYAEFFVLPCDNDEHDDNNNDLVMLKSAKHGYLRVDDDCNSLVGAPLEQGVDLKPYQWRLVKQQQQQRTTVRYSITSATGGGSLAVRDGIVFLDQSPVETTTTWSLDFLSGELLYISSKAGLQIRCDVLGRVCLTETCKGWEVWRFVEAGESRVRIHSWMHNRYLSIKNGDETRVTTTSQPGTLWEVEKADGNGVIIRASETGHLLCRRSDNDKQIVDLFATTGDDSNDEAIWMLEAAHQQTYTFRCSDDNRSLGPFPWVTDNHKQTNEFRIEVVNDSASVTVLSMRTNQYVGVVNGKVVALLESPYVWQMTILTDGTYQFQAPVHDGDAMYLAVLKHEAETQAGPGELKLLLTPSYWCLEPVMPRAVSSSKIRTFAAGTTLAVATTVAMPFAVAGVVGLIGTEMGLLANAVAVTLTSAEAIASVGVVGATAAICFRQSMDTLSASLEDQAEEGAKKYSKRPFCDWRSW